ncbi:MAG: ATP synthase subunit I [Candidatus Zixiibacteriota bacterium]
MEFVTRIIKTTAVVSLVVSLCLSYYFDWKMGLGFLVGACWSLVNLIFIKSLIKEVISTNAARKTITAVLALLKFPLLYVAGYFIIAADIFSVYALLAGFSLMFAIIVLKVLGRLIVGLDVPGVRNKQPEGNA